MMDADNMDAEEEGEEEEEGNTPPGGDDVCAEKSNDKNKSDEKKWPHLPSSVSVLSKKEALEILEIFSPTPTKNNAFRKDDDDADLSKQIKLQYRKLCLKYHPDKNSEENAERASRAFTAITAAYHTLTTVNFNQEKWLKTFSIPPMQSLSDVLQLALKGADPEEIERLMRARGEYRPHRNFGIDYNVRWESGEKPDPAGGMFRETAMNEYSDTKCLSDGFDSMRVGEDREKRPWEVVGGVGYENQKSSLLLGDVGQQQLHHKRKYEEREKKNLDLLERFTPLSNDAKIEAERLNDIASSEYEKGRYEDAMVLFDGIVKLMPDRTPYRTNRASCALKVINALEGSSAESSRRQTLIAKVIEDCEKALEIDNGENLKAKVRGAEAYVKLGDSYSSSNRPSEQREGLKNFLRAKKWFTEVLSMNPNNKRAKDGLKDCLLSLELIDEYDSDREYDVEMM